MRVKFLNERRLHQRIDSVMPVLEQELKGAVNKGLDEALEHSQRAVAVRSGALKSTGRTTKAKKAKGLFGDSIQAEISYGGRGTGQHSQTVVRYAIESEFSPLSSSPRFLRSGIERADLDDKLDDALRVALGKV